MASGRAAAKPRKVLIRTIASNEPRRGFLPAAAEDVAEDPRRPRFPPERRPRMRGGAWRRDRRSGDLAVRQRRRQRPRPLLSPRGAVTESGEARKPRRTSRTRSRCTQHRSSRCSNSSRSHGEGAPQDAYSSPDHVSDRRGARTESTQTARTPRTRKRRPRSPARSRSRSYRPTPAHGAPSSRSRRGRSG